MIMQAIITGVSSVLVGVLTLIGVILSNNRNRALTDYRLDELTKEVREHNNFARRVPVLEEKMTVANHRIDDLEQLHKK